MGDGHWSRELFAPAEQRLLERLAVIPAPFTADLAIATAGGVRRGLAILVEQSLLRLEDGAGGPRYRMLETVREYGEARLDAAGGRETAMAGLVGWAVRQAVTLAADFIGPAQIEALARCAADQDNLVAVLRWSQDHNDEPAAVDIATALFHRADGRPGRLAPGSGELWPPGSSGSSTRPLSQPIPLPKLDQRLSRPPFSHLAWISSPSRQSMPSGSVAQCSSTSPLCAPNWISGSAANHSLATNSNWLIHSATNPLPLPLPTQTAPAA